MRLAPRRRGPWGRRRRSSLRDGRCRRVGAARCCGPGAASTSSRPREPDGGGPNRGGPGCPSRSTRPTCQPGSRVPINEKIAPAPDATGRDHRDQGCAVLGSRWRLAIFGPLVRRRSRRRAHARPVARSPRRRPGARSAARTRRALRTACGTETGPPARSARPVLRRRRVGRCAPFERSQGGRRRRTEPVRHLRRHPCSLHADGEQRRSCSRANRRNSSAPSTRSPTGSSVTASAPTAAPSMSKARLPSAAIRPSLEPKVA